MLSSRPRSPQGPKSPIGCEVVDVDVVDIEEVTGLFALHWKVIPAHSIQGRRVLSNVEFGFYVGDPVDPRCAYLPWGSPWNVPGTHWSEIAPKALGRLQQELGERGRTMAVVSRGQGLIGYSRGEKGVRLREYFEYWGIDIS